MPDARTVAARSSQPWAGGRCADVQHSASRSTRPVLAASQMPTMPPSDSPQNENVRTPSESSSATTSPASPATE